MNTIQTYKLLRENLASFYNRKFKYALGVEATEPRYRKNPCLEYGLYSVKKPHLAFRYYTGTSWPVRLFNAQIPDDDYVCIKGHMCVKDSILYKSPRMTLVEEVPYISAFKCLKNSSKDLVDRIVNAGLNLEDDYTRENKVTSLAANLCEQLGLDSSPVIIRGRDDYDDVIRAVTYHPGSKGYEMANQVNLTKKDMYKHLRFDIQPVVKGCPGIVHEPVGITNRQDYKNTPSFFHSVSVVSTGFITHF